MTKDFTIKTTKPYEPFETFSPGVATEELVAAGATDCRWVHFVNAMIEPDGDIRLSFITHDTVTDDYHDTDYEWSVIYVISQRRGIVEVELSQHVTGARINEVAAAATNARLDAERDGGLRH